MAFSQDTLDQIRESVSIVDIINQYTTLKMRGGKHIGLCPFHSEKTPSFNVNEDKGLYHCFGCGKGGDLFTFIMEVEGLSFNEAVERLAEHVGIELKRVKSGDRGLSVAFEFAQEYFTRNIKSVNGKSALTYLANRGISQKLAKEFGIGLALSEWYGFYKFAIKKGINENHLHTTGLIKTSKIGKPIDFFINGITIPIRNRSGHVIGFGMRNLGDDGPKYVNSPEHPLYKKSNTLFGFNFARRDIRQNNIVYLTEGYFDAISLWERGFRNVMAGCGTALTEQQAYQIKRLTDSAVLFYDGDNAGKAAALKAIPLLLKAGVSVRVLNLPDQEDPDSYARSIEKEQLDKFMASHIDFFAHLTNEAFQNKMPSSVPEKVEAMKFFYPYINSIDDSLSRSMYIANLADLMNHPRDEVERAFRSKSLDNKKAMQSEQVKVKKDRARESELLMISYVLCNNKLIEFIDKINPFVFYRGVFESIRDVYYDKGNVSLNDISSLFSQKDDVSFIGRCVFNAEDEKAEINFIKSLIHNQMNEIQQNMRQIKNQMQSIPEAGSSVEKLDEKLLQLDKKKKMLFQYIKDPYKLLEHLKK